jgi:hypothetical protein
MKIEDFNLKIEKHKMPNSWYSINDGMKFNASILLDNKTYWESFYYDEKGETNNLHLFSNEDEALDYLWGEIEDMIKLYHYKTGL